MPLYPARPAGNQPVVQARRTTTFTLGAGFADISLDATDVQSNSAIIEHSGDNVTVRVAGNYSITYAMTAPAGVALIISAQVRKNDTSVLNGSVLFTKAATIDEQVISKTFIAALAANDFVTLQANADAGAPELAAGLTINAIHKNVGNEISTIDEKLSVAADDLFVIEDSEAAGVKKKVKGAVLPAGAPLSNTAPVNVTKAAADKGVGTASSRYDHKHDISVAAPAASAVAVGNTADVGAATSLSLSDHQHAVAKGTPVSVGTGNSAGAGTDFAAGNHVHAGLTRGAGDFAVFTAKAVPTTSDILLIEDANAANAKKQITIGTLPVQTPLSDVAPANVTRAAADKGVAAAASRQDHKHDVSSAAPASGAVAVGNAAAAGSGPSLSLSDHQHAVASATPVSVGTANAPGSAATFVCSDHVHAGLTRGSGDFATFTAKTTPVSADILLIEDSAATNAKKQTTVGEAISNYLKATVATAVLPAITTSSLTDIIATSMTLTPIAGTYLVWFTGSVSHSANGGSIYTSIYYGVTQNAASERNYNRGGNQSQTNGFACDALVTVNGSQAITGQWRTSGATATMYQRTLAILRVA
jgi:hypothetical protein